ncbi:hypothetical protein NF212_12985 [Parasalinivibrio latis]|uniref:hypothetical protein n=1 Tax=Parasalinivibrio latis TaxID=2952610 RepID=UPI0030DEB09B
MNVDITSALLARILTASNMTSSSTGSSVNTPVSLPLAQSDTTAQQALQHLFSRLPVYAILLPLLSTTQQGRSLASQLLPPGDPEKLKAWLEGRKAENALLSALKHFVAKGDADDGIPPTTHQQQHALLKLLALQKALASAPEHHPASVHPQQEHPGREFQWNIPTGHGQNQLIEVIVKNDESQGGKAKRKKERWHLSVTLPVLNGVIKAEAIYEKRELSLTLTASDRALKKTLIPITVYLEERLALHGISLSQCSVTEDVTLIGDDSNFAGTGLSIKI